MTTPHGGPSMTSASRCGLSTAARATACSGYRRTRTTCWSPTTSRASSRRAALRTRPYCRPACSARVWPGRRRWRSSTLPEPYRRPPGKGSRPSPAARGVVKVDADFPSEYPEGDAASTEAYASLARAGAAALLELDRAISASFDMLQPTATVLAVLDGAARPLTPSEIGERVIAPSATMTANLDLLERRG